MDHTYYRDLVYHKFSSAPLLLFHLANVSRSNHVIVCSNKSTRYNISSDCSSPQLLTLCQLQEDSKRSEDSLRETASFLLHTRTYLERCAVISKFGIFNLFVCFENSATLILPYSFFKVQANVEQNTFLTSVLFTV